MSSTKLIAVSMMANLTGLYLIQHDSLTAGLWCLAGSLAVGIGSWFRAACGK